MAELFGRRDGLSKGKGGSMHLFDKSVNFLGGHAIVAAHLPLAAGAAFAIKYQGGDQVVLCYFGDGAVPEGEFHEAMNLAALWKLPVIFVCENNRYAMGTAIHRALAQTEIWRFAEHYGDARARQSTAWTCSPSATWWGGRSSARARDKSPAPHRGAAPTASAATRCAIPRAPCTARTRRSSARRQRDPIALFSDRCAREGVLGEADVAAIEKSSQRHRRRGGRVRRGLPGAARGVAAHRRVQGLAAWRS